MVTNDIIRHKRTVIIPKQGSLSEQTFSTVSLAEIDASLVLRNSSNGFYTYDVIITGRQIASVGVVVLKFIITDSQDDKTDVTSETLGGIDGGETLFATATVRVDSTNNVLSTHTLSVYAEVTV